MVGARRHLKDNPELACNVLGEVGRTEDVALIWDATHRPTAKPPLNWYAGPAAGWLAIIRLTNHLPPAAKPG